MPNKPVVKSANRAASSPHYGCSISAVPPVKLEKMKILYLMLAGLVVLLAFFGTYVFEAYAQGFLGLMIRGAEQEGASEEVIRQLAHGTRGASSQIALLSGTLLVVAALGFISFLINCYLSTKLNWEREENRRLTSGLSGRGELERPSRAKDTDEMQS